jgi:EVE domain
VAKTWVLTGSLDNFRATREHGFAVIGAKEGRRGMAEQIAPGDRIVFYVTGLQAFGGIVRITGEMYEDREKIWPGKPGKVDAAGEAAGSAGSAREDYPWRFATEPEIVLDEDRFVPAVELAPELEHVRKWPLEHWQLAFQGQLRTVPEADAELLERRIREGSRAAV